ncbi:hypothetical protein BKA62DRAFT_77603 [Auriculariales sp. MPI-PUGE-AT-0066]|nr:hypothetical protein BKA62DRAFT_77603 [Auriculariales sp. MPI-PUGE-AT-0066]
MLAYTLLASVLASTVLAQKSIGTGSGTVVVTSTGLTGGSGCLTATGTVTTDTTACGTFTATSAGSGTFDGATLNAGSGACGFNMTDRATPLVCAEKTDKQLGFYSFLDKLATLEMQINWFLDETPEDSTTKTLFWQGVHPDTATLTWKPSA